MQSRREGHTQSAASGTSAPPVALARHFNFAQLLTQSGAFVVKRRASVPTIYRALQVLSGLFGVCLGAARSALPQKVQPQLSQKVNRTSVS